MELSVSTNLFSLFVFFNCMKENPKEVVKKLVSKYIQEKSRQISLRLYWKDKKSAISVKGEKLDETIEYPITIDFTSFAHGVIEAYREAYGDLKVVPISFREEVYRNDKISLDLYQPEVLEYLIFT